MGLTMVQQRLAGTDGRKGKKFTLAQLQGTLFNNRVLGGDLTRDSLAQFCEANPTLVGSSGPVDVSAACPVIANWDKTYNLDSPGALLFRRFASRGLANSGTMWKVPFDPNDPVNTPNTLNTLDPAVGQALANAVTDLRGAGIPLDAKLRDYQYVTRNGERIPIPGGPSANGAFNVISNSFTAGKGLGDVTAGSSFIMAASMTGDACPKVKTLLTYSQAATNPGSANFDDQTKLFSQKKWLTDRFCRSQQLKSPGLKITKFGGGAKVAAGKGF